MEAELHVARYLSRSFRTAVVWSRATAVLYVFSDIIWRYGPKYEDRMTRPVILGQHLLIMLGRY
jgi:hypothetical protein